MYNIGWLVGSQQFLIIVLHKILFIYLGVQVWSNRRKKDFWKVMILRVKKR